MSMEIFHNVTDGDLKNEDVVIRILSGGSAEQIEKLRLFHNLTKEQIELFQYYAKLRKSVHEKMREEIRERIKKNPIATEEELNMGAYIEFIEPQVKDAVINLRRKGYNTFLSGFDGYHSQKISFDEEPLKDYCLPQQLINETKVDGVDVVIKPNYVKLVINEMMGIDEIKKIWDKIENNLPVINKNGAEPSRGSISFKQKQKKLQSQ